MAIAFPPSPANGDTFSAAGRSFVFRAPPGVWESVDSSIEEAPQDGTPYSRQDASWVPVAEQYWLDGGIAITNSLDLMDGGDANSTPANLTMQSGLPTVG